MSDHPAASNATRPLPRAVILVFALVSAALGMFAALGVSAAPGTPATLDRATTLHVLNRVTFGPRSRDVDALRSAGFTAYLEQQLHPERIPDADLDRRLAAFETLPLSSTQIARRFAQPLFAARRDRRRSATATTPSPDDGSASTTASPDADRAATINPDVARAAALPLSELSQQKVLRAVYSDRQLEAVLVDFWFNHFNVDARKGLDRFLVTEYERDTIRPHVFGRFRDLLGATAKSPAMLFYLDNWLSGDPNGPHASAPGAGGLMRRDNRRRVIDQRDRRDLRDQRPDDDARARLAAVKPQKKGLNENYARELMELHTLGVDGGYTQRDVTEVARAFTGWTIDRPRQGGVTFLFDPRLHDPGDKVILGHTIRGGDRDGERDGEAVLDLLARHPATARFISAKLARRFVSDTPPAALVDRMAARFGATDGDLREVMHTLLTSPEFLSPASVGAKTKTPFEFVVSAIRAIEGEISDARPIVQHVAGLGMPLFQCQPPTGYKDTGDAWTNAGALVARMNVAQLLAQATRRSGLAGARPLDRSLVAPLSVSTEAVIARATSDWQRVALTLGSPEFQKK